MLDIGLSGTLNIRMAFTYFALVILVVSANTLVTQTKTNMDNDTTPIIKSVLDPKRRSELIDEAFLEQKDILLDMLETKLKEVRDKKKKHDRAENINEITKCESMPKEVDVVLKAHGISAIGDTDVRLKHGEDGNGTLSLDATGISNVGKVHVELGVGDGNVHIPGFDNVFTGKTFLKKNCNEYKRSGDNNTVTVLDTDVKPDQIDDKSTRRVAKVEDKLDVVSPLNETLNYVERSENNDTHTSNINDDNNNNNNSSSNVLTTVSTSVIPEVLGNAAEIVSDTKTFT